MNLVILIGNLGEDPIVRKTQDGTSVTTFSLATTERWKDGAGNKQEKTTWHKVQAWGTNADNCGAYLKKGSRLQVTGRNENQPWTDKEGIKRNPTIVVMSSMEMLGDPGFRGNTNANAATGTTPVSQQGIVPPPPQPQAQAGPTYQQMIAAGWTDDTLRANNYGHLIPSASVVPPPPATEPYQPHPGFSVEDYNNSGL